MSKQTQDVMASHCGALSAARAAIDFFRRPVAGAVT
jgi:hypothetical protein